MSWRNPQGRYSRPKGNWPGRSGVWHGGGRYYDNGAEMDDGDHLPVRHPSKYQGEEQALEAPHVVGSFSVDSEKNIRFDDSMMSVLSRKYIPEGDSMKVELDLNRGWHRINGYTGSTAETFKQFLQWVLKNQKNLTREDSPHKLMADIVCTKGVLKNIMQVPYASNENCEMVILAQYFKGSVYMTYQSEDYEGQKTKENSSLLEIYGHKFEHYMTGGDPDEVLECNCQFRCVLQLHLKELTLLYPTATDGVDQTRHKPNFKDMSSFVTVKARKDPGDEAFKLRTYRKYILNGWWIESQLSGIPRVLMGLRNHQGVVHKLQMLQTADFPNEAQGEWEPSVCINFLVKFLNFVKEKVVSEPHTIHRFERTVSSKNYIRHSYDNSVTHILPKWYRQQLFVSEENDDSSSD